MTRLFHTRMKILALLFCRVILIQCWFNRSLYNQRYTVHISEEVEHVMNELDRANYVSRPCNPYADKYRSIGYGSSMSAPHLHAWVLEFFRDHFKTIERGKVLDVGSGSGYMTAAFAVMMGPHGRVIGIDHNPKLIERARRNVQKDNPELLSSGRVTFVTGNGKQGYIHEAPYDAIYVGASCFPVPKEIMTQLKPGGRLLIPLKLYDGGGGDEGGQILVQVDKLKNSSTIIKARKHVVCPPLTDKWEQ